MIENTPESLHGSEQAQTNENAIDLEFLPARLRNGFEDLDEDERQILVRRFGLTGERCQSLEEVAAAFGVDRETIRLRELHHAMHKLYDNPPEA